MRRILFDVLEVNIAVSIVILLVCLLEGKLRKRYGAGWLKIVWFVLAVRLLIPYNFSLPFTELRFFNVPGFEQEETDFFVPNQKAQGIVAMGLEGVSGTQVYGNMAQSGSPDAKEGVNKSPEVMPGKSEGQGLPVQDSHSLSASDIVKTGQSDTAQNVTQSIQSSTTQDAPPSYAQEATQNTGMPGQLAVAPTTSQSNHVPSLQSKDGAFAHNPSKSEGNKAAVASYSNILVIVWLLGIVVGIMYFVLSNISFYIACKKTMRPVTESPLLERINILQERMLGKVKLAVYQSSVINSPMLVGLVKPKLVLPVHKQEWQAKELEYIIAHELCHYRNKDLWLKLLMMLAWCLNWFNPLVLLMKKKCFFHIELACDGCVLEGMEPTARREYAGMLVSFAGKKQEVSAFSTNFGGSKKRMKQRIDYALDTHTRKKGIVSMLTVALSMIVMCLLISCGYKPDEVEPGGLEPGQNQIDNSLQSGPQTEQLPEQGTGLTEAPATETPKEPTGEPEPTESPKPTEAPASIEDRKPVLTEEYELIYENINMFKSGTTGSYFKYKNTYADLYMRRLQDDTREYIELSLWAPQQEVWHTKNNDLEGYVEAYPLFWHKDSKNLTLEQGQCYYVVELDGTVYLMRYCVENTSNVVTMSYKVFGVSSNINSPYYYLGHEVPYDADGISIYLASDSGIDKDVSFPIEQMAAFADTVKGYMENGYMVASSLHGAFEFGVSADRDNPISPYLYDIFPWIPKLITQQDINMEGMDSPKKLLTALQNTLPTEDPGIMPDVAADGSCFITGDYYSDSDESYLTIRRKEDGSYEGALLIANAMVADFVGYYDNAVLTVTKIIDYPDELPCEMEISFQNGKATVTITAASECNYPVKAGDTLTLDRNEKPEEFEYLRNAEYPARE